MTFRQNARPAYDDRTTTVTHDNNIVINSGIAQGRFTRDENTGIVCYKDNNNIIINIILLIIYYENVRVCSLLYNIEGPRMIKINNNIYIPIYYYTE